MAWTLLSVRPVFIYLCKYHCSELSSWLKILNFENRTQGTLHTLQSIFCFRYWVRAWSWALSRCPYTTFFRDGKRNFWQQSRAYLSAILGLFYTFYTCIQCVKQTEDDRQAHSLVSTYSTLGQVYTRYIIWTQLLRK